MVSTKNTSPTSCIKCGVMLDDNNWALYDKKASNYICRGCRKLQNKKYYQNDPLYSDKQLARTRFIKSAVIFAYGNSCNQCHEDDYDKLTIDHIKENKKEISNIYEWLYNNTILKDEYQVLCYNCNCSKNIVYKDKYNLRDKIKIIDNYGSQCIICKEDRIERLIINYANGDGAQQRRNLKCHTGSRMYRWIIKNNYPSDLGLQVLCFNCSKLFKNKKEIK